MRNRFLIIAATILLCLSGLALYLDQHYSQAKQTPEGAKAPALKAAAGPIYSVSISDSDGKMQSLGQWQNKLLIINFWATWCAPCVEEMPQLSALQNKYGAKNVQIVGIAADNQANVAKFKNNLKVSYPLLVDEMGALEFSKRLGNRVGLLPHSVVVEAGGEVLFSKIGKINVAELTRIIEENRVKIQ